MTSSARSGEDHARQLDVDTHFAQLLDDGSVQVHEGGSAFWQRLFSGELPNIDAGRVITTGRSEADWGSWERHPAGDEIVLLLDGEATLVVELPTGVRREIPLAGAGSYAVVPRGCWHTMRVHTPCRTLVVTPGKGTEHRPLSDGERSDG